MCPEGFVRIPASVCAAAGDTSAETPAAFGVERAGRNIP